MVSVFLILFALGSGVSANPWSRWAEAIVPESSLLEDQGYEVIRDEHPIPILSTDYSKRRTTKLRLTNKLQVWVISDPLLAQSAIGLSVQAGSWQNPKSALGLAHFCEHMAFMGDKSNPTPGSLDDFLAAHSSPTSNAETMGESTSYAISVEPSSLIAAMKRMVEMFTAPLFTEAALKSEINAVNQEFEMHRDQDSWRQSFVNQLVRNPKHPGNEFSIGTLHSLHNVTHTQMAKFFRTHYSANLMNVVVYTAMPLKVAVPKLVAQLSQIPNRNLPLFKENLPLLDSKMQGKLVWQKAIEKTSKITLEWEILGIKLDHTYFAGSPDKLVAYLLNSQASNSLCSSLKKEHLIDSLLAYGRTYGRDNLLFKIDIRVTPEGLRQRSKVIGLVMQALARTKQGFPAHVFQNIHHSEMNLYKWQFSTNNEFNSALSHAANLAVFPMATYPQLMSVVKEFNHPLASQFVAQLTAERMHISVLAPDFEKTASAVPTSIEPYYGAEYKVFSVSRQTLSKWAHARIHALIDWPVANPFIPTHLALSHVLPNPPVYPKLPTPTKLIDQPTQKLWLWHDRVFGDPWISIKLNLKTNFQHLHRKYGRNATQLTTLLVGCINHLLLSGPLAQYNEAGLAFTLVPDRLTGMMLTITGSNPTLKAYSSLLQAVIHPLKLTQSGHLIMNPKEFAMVKLSTTQAAEALLNESPAQQALRWNKLLTVPHTTTAQSDLSVLAKLTFGDVAKFGQELLRQIRVEGFFAGQISEKSALATWKLVTALLPTHQTPIPSQDLNRREYRQLHTFKYSQEFGTSPAGNCTVLTLDPGFLDCKQRQALVLLSQAIAPDFYRSLRTQQQTGYLVQATLSEPLPLYPEITLLVQSSLYSAADLLRRFDKYLARVRSDLASGESKVMPEATFKVMKAAKLVGYRKPSLGVSGTTTDLNLAMDDLEENFHAFAHTHNAVQALTYSDILEMGAKMFAPSGVGRLAILYTPKIAEAVEPSASVTQVPKDTDSHTMGTLTDATISSQSRGSEGVPSEYKEITPLLPADPTLVHNKMYHCKL